MNGSLEITQNGDIGSEYDGIDAVLVYGSMTYRYVFVEEFDTGTYDKIDFVGIRVLCDRATHHCLQ